MYAADRLLADAAYISHHLHLTFDEILDLEHNDREYLISQIESWYPSTDDDRERTPL